MYWTSFSRNGRKAFFEKCFWMSDFLLIDGEGCDGLKNEAQVKPGGSYFQKYG